MRGISLARPATGGRLEWMDLLRGTAIILVLLWHAPAIPALFDWPSTPWLTAINNFFLPFRMPTLMFLSGLLLPATFKKGWRAYYLGKVRSLVWPYVIWSLIYFAQYGSKIPLWHWRAWYADGYLWFLFFITVYYFVAPVVTKLPAWLTPWLFMLVSISVNTPVEKHMLYFATFFFLGYWMASKPAALAAIRGWKVIAMAVVAVGFGVASSIWGLDLAYRGEFALLSVCGVLVAVWLAVQADGQRWTRAVTFIGRNSLVYYVVHFPVMTLVIFAALALGLPQYPYIWIPNLILGAGVATCLALGRRKPWISWLFDMPRFLLAWLEPRAKVTPARRGSEPNQVGGTE